jgi:uncharacterized protein
VKSNLPKTNILRLTIEIAVFVAVVVADAYGLVPITQTLFLVPLIWVMLRLSGERWSEIGFASPDNFGWAIMVGVLAGVLMELFAVYVTTPLISSFFGTEPNYSQFKEIRGNLVLLFIFLGLSWTMAAFGEEICFRGFLMNRLERFFGESRVAWLAALLLSSILFGWGHTEQGVSGWIQEGLSGLILGILFLSAKRNLVVPIVAHGISNTLAFILIYLGRYPGLG